MSCCCERTRDSNPREPLEFDGLNQSGEAIGEDIGTDPHRFLVSAGCVLDETHGVWTRIVASPGYESVILRSSDNGPDEVAAVDITSTSILRLESFDGSNFQHNQKQRYQNYRFAHLGIFYDSIIWAWYNQQVSSWQIVFRETGTGTYGLVTVDAVADLSTTVLFDDWFENPSMTENGVGHISVMAGCGSSDTIMFRTWKGAESILLAASEYAVLNGDDGSHTSFVYDAGGYYLLTAEPDLNTDVTGEDFEEWFWFGHPGWRCFIAEYPGNPFLPYGFWPEDTVLAATIDGTTFSVSLDAETEYQVALQLLCDEINAGSTGFVASVHYPESADLYLGIQGPVDYTQTHTMTVAAPIGEPAVVSPGYWHGFDASCLQRFRIEVLSNDTYFGWCRWFDEALPIMGSIPPTTVYYFHSIFFSLQADGTLTGLKKTFCSESWTDGFGAGTYLGGNCDPIATQTGNYTFPTYYVGNGDGSAALYIGSNIETFTVDTKSIVENTTSLTPWINTRYQPNWGTTSTGYVEVGSGYRYTDPATFLCGSLAESPYHHYTLAGDYVWGTHIVDDAAHPGKDILAISKSNLGGSTGIVSPDDYRSLLFEHKSKSLRRGDIFGAIGAYALAMSLVNPGEPVSVYFESPADTFYLVQTCKAQCVIECGDIGDEEFSEPRSWYTNCKCTCRPEDSPGQFIVSNNGRLYVHVCNGVTGDCPGGGVCLYRLSHVDSAPGDFVPVTSVETFNELFIGVEGAGPRAWIINAGGTCECYCPCLGDALFAAKDSIIESGGFTNGGIIQGRCFSGPQPDCEADPPPYDCNSAGSTMVLNTTITTACHSWTGNINLSGVAGSGLYEIADFIVPGTDDCLRADVELTCVGGSAAQVVMVIRNADSSCSKTYNRYARHVGPTNVYEVTVSDATNTCCCACSMCGLPAELDWVYNTFFGGVPEATYNGTVDFQTGNESGCTWSVPDPGSAAIPMSVQLTKLGPSSYRLEINAGSGFEGTVLYLTECPTGSITTYDQREEFAMNNVTINFG